MAESGGDDRTGKTIAPASFVFHPTERPGKRRTTSFGADDPDDSDGTECPSAAKLAKNVNTPVFPPLQPVISRNVFMTSPPSQSANSSDSDSEESKPSGFRLKPATLIAGRSSEAESAVKFRSVLRPATLHAPPTQQPPPPAAEKTLTVPLLKPATLHPPPFLGSASEKASGEAEETARGDAEESRGDTEETRGDTEETRGDTEETRGDTEETRGDTEETRGEVGETRGDAGETRGHAETQGDAEETRADASKDPASLLPPAEKQNNNKKTTTKRDKEVGGSSEEDSGTNYFLQCLPQPAWGGRSKAEGELLFPATETTFVFGQNMNERVVSPVRGDEAERGAEGSERDGGEGGEEGVETTTTATTTTTTSTTSTTTSTAMMTSSSPSSRGNHSPSVSTLTGVSPSPCLRTLEESAAAYTKATSKRCLLETVETRTGEEAESNVLQVQCKLFVLDAAVQSWVERGRGSLRLNDMASLDDGSLQSRLVMRTQGSLRLILNTKVWAHMQLDKASERGVRVTALDADEQRVRVFLITASLKDTGQLFAALHHRILALRNRDTETDAATTTTTTTTSTTTTTTGAEEQKQPSAP
ncbi:uncharacterized protein LOC116936923 isoform X2 [Petromyzon marinus]|uniref:uncharacterized protein LOC116936923 isoform X2 n=1 Tax=Petromyzon marinus TaxID=7757 RepID=UPI003F710AAC